jgi:hypothetical protein
VDTAGDPDGIALQNGRSSNERPLGHDPSYRAVVFSGTEDPLSCQNGSHADSLLIRFGANVPQVRGHVDRVHPPLHVCRFRRCLVGLRIPHRHPIFYLVTQQD